MRSWASSAQPHRVDRLRAFSDFPWLLVLSAFALMNLLRTVAGKSEIVGSEVKRLERKQAKEIQSRNKKQFGP